MIYQLETLESLIEFNKQLAESWYKEKGYLVPTIVGYTQNNQGRIVIADTFKDEKEKEQWMKTATMVFFIFDIDKYVVMTECWMARVNGKNEMEKIYQQYGSLENYPGRIDCLNILAVNKLGAKMAVMEITKDKTLKNFYNENNYHEVSGRLCDLIPKNSPKISAAEKQKLIKFVKSKGLALEDIP